MFILFAVMLSAFLGFSDLNDGAKSDGNMKKKPSETMAISPSLRIETNATGTTTLFKKPQNDPNTQVILTEYPAGKIVLKDGTTYKGKEIRLYADRITMVKNANLEKVSVFPLSEVLRAEGKGRKPRKLAAFCGGGCMGYFLALYAGSGGRVTDEETGKTVDIPAAQFLGVGMLVSLGAAGFGAVLGAAMDDWTVVYSGM